jgi:hypothetical protein
MHAEMLDWEPLTAFAAMPTLENFAITLSVSKLN